MDENNNINICSIFDNNYSNLLFEFYLILPLIFIYLAIIYQYIKVNPEDLGRFELSSNPEISLDKFDYLDII